MQPLTDYGRQQVSEIAARYGVSTDAVLVLLQAVVNGQGTMAQFYHPELGGGGQWMAGGMTMVGDMFNHGLKAKVDGLCGELSNLLASQPFVPRPPAGPWQGQSQQQNHGTPSLFVAPAGGSGGWWPAELGQPNASGGQNDLRYAYFAGPRRLAVDLNGRVWVYDTLDHQIGGVSQQQGGGQSLTFTSQYGTVRLADLPVVSIEGVAQAAAPPPAVAPAAQRPAATENEIFAKIEGLADLHRKGVLSGEEFAAKKAELLSRL